MGASFVNWIEDPTVGHVGAPTTNCEYKLVQVEELNYICDQTRSEGEVWMRGPGIFAGYYKEEEKTRETLTEDGWLKTGDIGKILPNGALKLVDRKKNIFKLSQGEYVAPEKIELIYQ